MAIIKELTTGENGSNWNYLATAALLCAVACTVLGLNFRGFRATMTFTGKNKKRSSAEFQNEEAEILASTGVYRPYRDETYTNGVKASTPRVFNPATVQLPPPSNANMMINMPQPSSSKETSDKLVSVTSTGAPAKPRRSMNNNKLTPINVPKSSEVSDNPNGSQEGRAKTEIEVTNQNITSKEIKQYAKNRQKEEKQRVADQKKRDKVLIADILKDDQKKVEREVKLKKEKQKSKKDSEKKKESKPKVQKVTNPLAQVVSNQVPNQSYSTGTMNSSISTTSGPPPYTPYAEPKQETTQSEDDKSGNTSFGKPIDSFGTSWDLVSQHRQQMKRPANPDPSRKALNLQYQVGKMSINEPEAETNSEA